MVKLFLLFFMLVINLYPQDFKVEAFTDTSEYLIGDHIKVNYIVDHDKGISFAEPAFRNIIKDMDFISSGLAARSEEKGRIISKYEVVVSRYDSADVRIEPATWYYWFGDQKDKAAFLMDEYHAEDTTVMRAKSNEVNFRVSAVKVNVEEDIKDIKAPLSMPPDWRLILIYSVIGLLIIAIAVYLYKKLRKKETDDKPKIIIPPHIKALTALEDLERKNLWQKGEIKEFHSEITEIIRKYFEERFGLPALELTTGETMLLLSGIKDAQDIISDAEEFLSNADLVKFAKLIPINNVNENMMKKAYSIVEQTVPSDKSEEEKVTDVQ
jgi:hypothetical protein